MTPQTKRLPDAVQYHTCRNLRRENDSFATTSQDESIRNLVAISLHKQLFSQIITTANYTIHNKAKQRNSNMMMNKIPTVAVMALLAYSSDAFTPSPRTSASAVEMSSMATAVDLPYFIDVKENNRQEQDLLTDVTSAQSAAVHIKAAPMKKKDAPKKSGGAVHKQGIFSPVVLAAKAILGEEQLNKIRAKGISIHSDVIASFVETHELPTGQAALKTLFSLVDKDGNGTISESELSAAFQTLGFTWLKEKQVKGIFARADADENGDIDLQEFMNEAPKTLRTNLIKLAKQNGGDLGFLV